MPTVAQASRRLRSENPGLYEKAKEACAHAANEYEDCVNDVMATGDVASAEVF
jgi:hypothetical protein